MEEIKKYFAEEKDFYRAKVKRALENRRGNDEYIIFQIWYTYFSIQLIEKFEKLTFKIKWDIHIKRNVFVKRGLKLGQNFSWLKQIRNTKINIQKWNESRTDK